MCIRDRPLTCRIFPADWQCLILTTPFFGQPRYHDDCSVSQDILHVHTWNSAWRAPLSHHYYHICTPRLVSEFSPLLVQWLLIALYVLSDFISPGFVKAVGHIRRYIRTNSGCIQRRKGLPRDTTWRAPQRRPTKCPLNNPNYFPPKAKRQKKPHCLPLEDSLVSTTGQFK